MSDLRGIVEVKEVDSVKEVNKLLAEGWVLLDTYRKVSGDSDDQRLIYVLGTDVPGPSGEPVEGSLGTMSSSGSVSRAEPKRRRLRYKGSYSGGTIEPCFIEYEDGED